MSKSMYNDVVKMCHERHDMLTRAFKRLASRLQVPVSRREDWVADCWVDLMKRANAFNAACYTADAYYHVCTYWVSKGMTIMYYQETDEDVYEPELRERADDQPSQYTMLLRREVYARAVAGLSARDEHIIRMQWMGYTDEEISSSSGVPSRGVKRVISDHINSMIGANR